MKAITKLAPLTKEIHSELRYTLKGLISKSDLDFFTNYVKPYNEFGNKQLDNIFLLAEITFEGNGEIVQLTPDCSVDQQYWYNYEDEPDIQIEPIKIPLKILLPKMPIMVESSKTVFTVFIAGKNIWDQCKELPEWIWNEGKFDFMLSVSYKTKDGKIYYGNQVDEYVSKVIEF